jgi:hypothetical protein
MVIRKREGPIFVQADALRETGMFFELRLEAARCHVPDAYLSRVVGRRQQLAIAGETRANGPVFHGVEWSGLKRFAVRSLAEDSTSGEVAGQGEELAVRRKRKKRRILHRSAEVEYLSHAALCDRRRPVPGRSVPLGKFQRKVAWGLGRDRPDVQISPEGRRALQAFGVDGNIGNRPAPFAEIANNSVRTHNATTSR